MLFTTLPQALPWISNQARVMKIKTRRNGCNFKAEYVTNRTTNNYGNYETWEGHLFWDTLRTNFRWVEIDTWYKIWRLNKLRKYNFAFLLANWTEPKKTDIKTDFVVKISVKCTHCSLYTLWNVHTVSKLNKQSYQKYKLLHVSWLDPLYLKKN